MKSRYTLAVMLAVLLLSWFPGKAQDFSFIRFGQNEGLRHSQVLDIAQDRNANLWLGTATRSIYRFDGRQFFEYKITIPGFAGSLFTFKVQPDVGNNIWVLTNVGLVYFNGEDSRVIPGKGDLRLGINTKLVLDKNNTPWVLDAKGDVFTLTNDTLTIREDIHTALGSKSAGFFFNEQQSLCVYSHTNSVVSVSADGTISKEETGWNNPDKIQLVTNAGRSYYLIAGLSAIYGYDLHTKKLDTLLIEEKPTKINQMAIDPDGQVWVLSAGKVFVIDNHKKRQWISDDYELFSNDALCLFNDTEKGVWFSIDVKGISKFRKQPWRLIPETVNNDITAILQNPADGSVLYGTFNGGILGYGKPLLVGKPVTSLLARSKHEIFVGTLKEGLFRITDGRPQRIFPDAGTALSVHGVGVWGNSILAGAPNGLYLLKDKGAGNLHTRQLVRMPGVSNPVVINDTVYFRTAGAAGGIMKLAGDSVVQVGPDFLKTSTVYGIKQYPGNGYIVFGEFPHILFFDEAFRQTASLDLSSVLSNILLVEWITPEKWLVGSNDGLYQLHIENKVLKSVKKYEKVDGYGGEELYVNAVIKRSNGEIIIGTVNGAYRYNPAAEHQDVSSPVAYLTGVQVRTKEITDSDNVEGYFRLPVNLMLKHNENSIAFSFSASNLSNPYNISFHHKLEGLETGWSGVGTPQEVIYSNLPPGSYTFMVQAVSENKVWGSMTTYSFTIAPAFWQTTAFFIAMSLLVVVLIIAAFYVATVMRIRKLRLKEQVRMAESMRLKKQMAMDFHDEMGNRLASMLTQASLLKNKHPSGEFYAVFDFFERTAHAIFHGTKDFIWSIDVKSNNLKEAISYLRDFGANYFEKNGINFHVSSEILSLDFDIAMNEGHNRHLILIFKEAMTNSLKHARAGNVYFNVSKIQDGFVLTFEDDGIGIHQAQPGNGMRNMRVRAAKIGGKVEMLDRPGGGTMIQLVIKL
ncbi:MAG: hypothetical protein KIT62_01740 [Cyclobacteriaceae bacterium]|nr:hypothetical protein [Cyclobacteriaceae bacterium]